MTGQQRPNLYTHNPGTNLNPNTPGEPDGFTVEILNDLIGLNRDSKDGYNLAAKNVENDRLRSAFHELASHREEVVGKLSMMLANHGGDPQESGQVAGMFHRAWINIKSAVSSDDEEIIEECIRGEETLQEKYEEVLTEANRLPAEMVEFLRKHAAHVSSTIGMLKTLED